MPESAFERNPPTLDARWREVSAGICTLKDRLMVVLDIAAALRLAAAA